MQATESEMREQAEASSEKQSQDRLNAKDKERQAKLAELAAKAAQGAERGLT